MAKKQRSSLLTMAQQLRPTRGGPPHWSEGLSSEHRARFLHGDCFSYHGGVGGFAVSVNTLVNRWDGNPATRASMTFFGHLHQFHWNAPNRWVCNGALPGTGPYSLKFGASDPCQALAIVDRDRGLTDATKIFAR